MHNIQQPYWEDILDAHPTIISNSIQSENNAYIRHPFCRGVGIENHAHQHGGYIWHPPGTHPTIIALPIPLQEPHQKITQYHDTYTICGSCPTLFRRALAGYARYNKKCISPSIQYIRQNIENTTYHQKDIDIMLQLHAQQLHIYDPIIDPISPHPITVLPPFIAWNGMYDDNGYYLVHTPSQISIWKYIPQDNQWEPYAIMPNPYNQNN